MKNHLTLLTLGAAILAIAATRQAEARPYGYAYTAQGQLFSFDLTNPSSVNPIGSPVGSTVKGIDVRPGTSTLYAVDINGPTSQVQIYTVNPVTGVRTPVGAAIPTTGTADNGAAYSIDAASPGYGFNFNPVTLQGDGSSRFRLVDAAGNNYRFNSSTGTVATVDGNVAYNDGTATPPALGAAAYTNSDVERAGPAIAPTALYYLDAANDVVAISDDPNAGTIQNAGPLGIDISTVVGMEIYSPPGNVAAGGGANFTYIVTTEDNGATYQLRTIPSIGMSAGTASASFGNFPAGFEPVGGFAIIDAPELTPPAAAVGYGYNAAGQLFSFPLTDPSTVTPIGAASELTVKGLDFRPGTDGLYSIAVGATTSQLSLVNINTGGVIAIGAAFPNTDPPVLGTNYNITAASQFGFDFNPTTLQTDGSIRIRLIDDNGTNLRLNSNTGAVASVDGDINIGGVTVTGVTGAAYTNSDTSRMGAATTPTRLYYLDAAADRLLTSPAANAGTSEVVGPIGADVAPNTAFDILSFSGFNVGYAAVELGGGTYTLHNVDLQTGAAGPAIGTFPSGFTPVNGFSTYIVPAAGVADTTAPRVAAARSLRSKTIRSERRRITLRGTAIDDTAVTQVAIFERGNRNSRVANGTRFWKKSVRLDNRRNVFRVIAFDAAGNISRAEKIVIRRR